MVRSYHRFTFRDSNFRLCGDEIPLMCAEIVRQRELLEAYIERHPEFKTSLVPLRPLADAPEIAIDMCEQSSLVGVGPLASVAGAIAERASRVMIGRGAREGIVENGGDVFAYSREPLMIGLHAGEGSPFNGVAFRLEPSDMPRAICSSSSRMGHSLSLGQCDLATVVAASGALADAGATKVCNMVKEDGDIDRALEYITSIPGIDGALIVKGEHIGILGSLPELVRNIDHQTERKITRDVHSRD